MPDDLSLRLQRSLGDAFVLERELGGGGMSRVFLANERSLDRRVVVKVLDLEGAVAASAERFRREVKVIAKLQHPHIVPVLAAGGDDTLLWYVMPYVTGESLRARLVREGALPLADAVRIGREMLDALAFAHEHGIVHRDIKPENILLEGRHAVVADFGVAKALAEAGVSGGLTTAGLALGTPAYMAPEQAMADPTTNHRADLYACGAVIYEMLVGSPPYSGNAQAVISAHLTAPVPRVEERRGDVPLALAHLIARLMAKNAAERPQSAHEAMAVLDGVTTPADTPLQVTTPGAYSQRSSSAPTPTAAAAGPRRRRVRLVAVAAVLVLGTLVSWFALRSQRGDVAAGADVIAVAPLGSSGDSALAQLGRDLVVTVSANLDGVGSLRAVDAMAVILRASKLPSPLPLDDARAMAVVLGAGSVLHGSLVRDAGLVRLDVALFPAKGGDPLARATARAPIDSIRALTDSLTVQIIRQVWKRGSPPSPFLSDVATASSEALRAFLSAETHVAKLEVAEALDDYARAIAADSAFALVFYRAAHLRAMTGLSADTAINAGLTRLKSRLPQRDREILAAGAARRPFLEAIDTARVLAARYPDHPLAQYGIADLIIHTGPLYGVPILDALPYLDRLDQIAPANADNALHQVFVAGTVADTAAWRAAARQVIDRAGTGASIAAFASSALALLGEPTTEMRGPVEAEIRARRDFLPALRASGPNGWIPFAYLSHGHSSARHDEVGAAIQRAPEFAEFRPQIRAARATAAAARGDFTAAISQFAEFERSSAPPAIRLGGIRAAAIGSWLGIVTAADANAALLQARANITGLGAPRDAELSWYEGLIAIGERDSSRMERASRESIADTGLVGRTVARSLRALWRERYGGHVDSLRRLEDESIATANSLAPATAVHRLALGRALVRGRNPAKAEYYLQWTDAVNVGLDVSLTQHMMLGYNSYERALAFESAGDRTRAMLHFQRFLQTVDRPGPAQQTQVDDARARLTKLAAAAR